MVIDLDGHEILADGEMSKVKERQNIDENGLSYYLNRAVETRPNVRCAREGFPMARRSRC